MSAPLTLRVQPAAEPGVKSPVRVPPLIVTVAVAPVSSGAATASVENGACWPRSVIAWAGTAPLITGTSCVAVTVTPEEALSTAEGSAVAMRRPMVSVCTVPGGATCAAGWNTSASTAPCTTAPTLVCAAKLRV